MKTQTSDKFQGKYRSKSTRLPGYDYASDGYYFVTICTRNREHFFGKISQGRMYFSAIGRIANQYWSDIPRHFPFVKLDAFVIMPNHIHGIIGIDKNGGLAQILGLAMNAGVDAQHVAHLPKREQNHRPQNKFGPQSQNLASIVRGFKSGVKKYATIHHIDFMWQSLFYDRIIRDMVALENVREYIRQNPANWENDINHFDDFYF